MNRTDLEEALDEALADIAPGFKIIVDRKGQVVIQTGLFEDEDGEISPPEEEAVDEEDPDFEADEDTIPLEDEDQEDD
jgi:hypothetical protein